MNSTATATLSGIVKFRYNGKRVNCLERKIRLSVVAAFDSKQLLGRFTFRRSFSVDKKIVYNILDLRKTPSFYLKF